MLANSKSETILSFVFMGIAMCILTIMFVYQNSLNSKYLEQIYGLQVALETEKICKEALQGSQSELFRENIQLKIKLKNCE